MGERRGTKALETWCRRVTQGYPGVKVENMTTSWRDGLAFCALIHHFRPDLIDFSRLDKSDVFGNNELAFRVAERHLGIPALLDAEDMAEYPVPDRLSILTYLSQFYQAFASNSSSPVKKASSDSPDSALVSLVQGNVQPQPKLEWSSRRREPCAVCELPVFLAQRLRAGGRLYHRTCFRCARCCDQLNPADAYETCSGVWVCETCPDEMPAPDEKPAPPPPDPPPSLVATRRLMFDTDDAKLLQQDHAVHTARLVHSVNKDLPVIVEPSLSIDHERTKPVNITIDKNFSLNPKEEDSVKDDSKHLAQNVNSSTTPESSSQSELKKDSIAEEIGPPIAKKEDKEIEVVSKNPLVVSDDTPSFNVDGNSVNVKQFSLHSDSDDVEKPSNDSDPKNNISDSSLPVVLKKEDKGGESLLNVNEVVEAYNTEVELSARPEETSPVPSVSVNEGRPMKSSSELERSKVAQEEPDPQYPEGLNPFGESEGEEPAEISKASSNPFGSDSEEEEPPRQALPSSLRSPLSQYSYRLIHNESPRAPPRKLSVGARSTVSTNPFDSDDEEDEASATPLSRTRGSLQSSPEPTPFPRRSRLRTSARSITSLTSICSSTSPRKKRPAPPPPTSGLLSPSSRQPSISSLASIRSRKTKRAPLPPTSPPAKVLPTSSAADLTPLSTNPNLLPPSSAADFQLSSSAVDLPPSSSAADLPPSSSAADLPPSSSTADLSLLSSAADLPPSSPSGDLPPSSSAADLPPSSSAADLPPSSSAAHLPPSSSAADLPPSSSAADLPLSSSTADLSLPSSAADLPPSSSAADLPPSSPSNDLPPSSSAADLPPSSSAADLPPSSSAAHLPPSRSAADLPPSSSAADLPPSSSAADRPARRFTTASLPPSTRPTFGLSPSSPSVSPPAARLPSLSPADGLPPSSAAADLSARRFTAASLPSSSPSLGLSPSKSSPGRLLPIPAPRPSVTSLHLRSPEVSQETKPCEKVNNLSSLEDSALSETTMPGDTSVDVLSQIEEGMKKLISQFDEMEDNTSVPLSSKEGKNNVNQTSKESGIENIKSFRAFNELNERSVVKSKLSVFRDNKLEFIDKDNEINKSVLEEKSNKAPVAILNKDDSLKNEISGDKAMGSFEEVRLDRDEKTETVVEAYNEDVLSSSQTSSVLRFDEAPPPVHSTPVKIIPSAALLDSSQEDVGYLSSPPASCADTSSYQESLASPPMEKRHKDSANLHTKITGEGGYVPHKSMSEQWKRKKGPAPALPGPQRRSIRPVAMHRVRQELADIEVKQQELERQGVALEEKIRLKFDSDTSITPYLEDLVLQLFELVNEKNELFRKQAELMYMRRQHQLEEEHAELEYQIRCLMARPEANKTDSDKELEEKLILRLVEVVERRDAIVQCLEMDRLREAEEDRSISKQLDKFTRGIVTEDRTKFKKKHKKKKDVHQTLKAFDLDKDLDESEKDSKRKKKKKWYTLQQKGTKHM